MRSQEFLQKLETYQKPIFTIADLVKISCKEKYYLKVYLFRLKKRGLIREIERGKYSLAKHPLVIASHLVFPGYISFLSAYSYYQMTSQIPIIINITSGKSKKKMFYGQFSFKFIKFKPQRMFGYIREKFMGSEIVIAEKEKAIIDSLYLPRYCPLDETWNALQEEDLDIDKLITYALRMDAPLVVKRLGYLLEKKGIDIFKKVKSQINPRYDYFDPSLKKVKERNKKWKLLVSEVW